MTGSQEPRLRVEPERTASDGPDAAQLFGAYASVLDPWQRLVLDCWMGTDKEGRYTVTSAGLSVPRQNGKNVILEAREFFGMVISGEKILHTAHQVRTSKKSFRRLVGIFTDKRHPEILELVKQIRFTNGEECIELVNGGTVEYSARSRQAARGFDGISLVVFDEAQELTDDQIDAILPTLSASATGTRQIIYTGTPPYPGCPGDVFRRRREAALTDPSPHDCWHEWSVAAGSLEEIRLGDRTIWAAVNPSMGLHLTEEFTAEELKTMAADGFARERLGWWTPREEHKQDLAIPAEVWDACKSAEAKPEGKTAYGVKFTADGSEVCLCGAVIPAEGIARITYLARKPMGEGTGWLADWLCRRYTTACCVVIDGRNGADVLTDKLTATWKIKGSVVRPSGKEVCAAASTLLDALQEQTVTWYAEQPELRESALSAVKRPISGGWGFGGENSAPVEAAALALWGARTCKRDPERKMRIG
ncbi:MAG: hypothetical protein IKO91_00670 [Oscillospiraceae bacterium]|nr:hypothetical protein [Oscillospiraceae bacterium]